MQRMVMEYLQTKKVINIKGNGKIICLMAQDKQHIQMILDMQDNFLIIKNMVEVFFFRDKISIEECLKMIYLMENQNI